MVNSTLWIEEEPMIEVVYFEGVVDTRVVFLITGVPSLGGVFIVTIMRPVYQDGPIIGRDSSAHSTLITSTVLRWTVH